MDYISLADTLLSGTSVFLTGSAGCGKTYLTTKTLEHLNQKSISIIRCGTTGVASLMHENGSTLHSAFMLPVHDHPANLRQWVVRVRNKMKSGHAKFERIRTAQIVLCDEISMCSAYKLELWDIECRIVRNCPTKPFGGLTLLLVGDFTQLPPVFKHDAKPRQHSRDGLYAFESPVWHKLNPKVVHLTQNYRQCDIGFAQIIYQLKQGVTLSESVRTLLRDKNQPPPESSMCVMIRAKSVNEYNKRRLHELPSVLHSLPFPKRLVCDGDSKDIAYDLQREVEASLYLQYCEKFQLFRTGVRVMLIVNIKVGELSYVNGDRGMIVGFSAPSSSALSVHVGACSEDSGHCPVVLFERTKQLILVSYHTFERKIEYAKIKHVAHLECIPLCLAEAYTVHKLQGASVSCPLHIVCDGMESMSSTFYVALSRGTSLDNITLENFQNEGRINPKALCFYNGTYELPAKEHEVMKTIEAVVQEDSEFSPVVDYLRDTYKRSTAKRKFIEVVEKCMVELASSQ